jgi:uncharacterized protein (TIGR02594 family)
MNIRDVQLKLRARGFNPGKVDGIWGPKTSAATRAFQSAQGLRTTGILNLKTMSELGFKADINLYPNDIRAPWMAEAQRRRRLHERRDHKTLWDWLRSDGATVGDPARVPWCGDFVETAVALTLPGEPIPENPYLALNWKKFGRALQSGVYGAILVFWRGNPGSWKGHVGFYWGEDDTHYHVLGGNQGNAVNVARIAKNRLRSDGIRWPSTVDHMTQPIHLSSAGVPVSRNEA